MFVLERSGQRGRGETGSAKGCGYIYVGRGSEMMKLLSDFGVFGRKGPTFRRWGITKRGRSPDARGGPGNITNLLRPADRPIVIVSAHPNIIGARGRT